MPPPISKKAENLKAETKKLEDIAKKKVQAIEKAEKVEEENTKKEIQQISNELEKFKKKTNDVLNGNAEGSGWDEQAVQVGQMMKQLIEQEARLQHNLLLKTDEASTELELKAKPIRKELPLVADFSEEDRIKMLTGIEKSIHKLKEKREMIEQIESKLNRQMQVLMECTPDPAEDKQTIMSKLQMSYDVVSGANDPDRARDDLLKQLSPSERKYSSSTVASSCSKKSNNSKHNAGCPQPHTQAPNAAPGHQMQSTHSKRESPPPGLQKPLTHNPSLPPAAHPPSTSSKLETPNTPKPKP